MGRALTNPDPWKIWEYVAQLFLLRAFTTSVEFFEQYLKTDIGENVSFKLRKDLFHHLQVNIYNNKNFTNNNNNNNNQFPFRIFPFGFIHSQNQVNFLPCLIMISVEHKTLFPLNFPVFYICFSPYFSLYSICSN